ncbi:MAG: hypothetical protein ACRELY_02765 [Polyangiaceae bacterium]
MSGAAYEAPRLCREKARSLIHTYAAGGCAWAVLPIPIATSTGLCALETHMIYWIGRVYGEELGKGDIFMIGSGLELASVGLKTVALNAANFLPVIGWAIKGAIAATTIEGLGEVIIRHFETRHPSKVYAG